MSKDNNSFSPSYLIHAVIFYSLFEFYRKNLAYIMTQMILTFATRTVYGFELYGYIWKPYRYTQGYTHTHTQIYKTYMKQHTYMYIYILVPGPARRRDLTQPSTRRNLLFSLFALRLPAPFPHCQNPHFLAIEFSHTCINI